jgi:2-succinyl-6-hydroxy-2,4-cyclohexadiene-1-carboxylate synthase
MQRNGNLSYTIIGNGNPVVFLHGFLESIVMWDYLKLEDSPFQSILIDLPGHGNSPLTDTTEDPSLEFMAEEVSSLLDFLNFQSYHIVGHSMGGYVALLLKEKDSRCKKVVLLNSNFWEDGAEKKNDRIRMAELVLQSKNVVIQEAIPSLFYRFNRKDNVVRKLVEEAKKMEAPAIAYASLAMRSRSDKKFLLIQNPMDFLIIQGENDPLIQLETMQKELTELHVPCIRIKESGHMAYCEQPEMVREIIATYLTD